MLKFVETIVGAAIASIVLMIAASCTNIRPTRLPDPPPPIVRPAEYAFGDTIAALDNRAAGSAQDLLRPTYGRGDELSLLAPAGTDFAVLARWYEARAQETGWRPVEDFTARLGRGRHGIAYASGQQAFALIWIDATAADGSRPVTMIRFGEPD
ncbi:hypothetical protein HNR00_004900 [Methylorubrum rhodinum]|uniref:Lipoprotein n=1 Tax=Methylorubrum rhodinum TaxID=29428 RepID=A0A840ZSP3_9HYPH|nr:hypothetical protein [Methylorubrum rhodinum]MBB5760154.1 hypothetical protein [Methylorubrum rhodinum]